MNAQISEMVAAAKSAIASGRKVTKVPPGQTTAQIETALKAAVAKKAEAKKSPKTVKTTKALTPKPAKVFAPQASGLLTRTITAIPGSRAGAGAARFALYKVGMTVQAYVDALAKAFPEMDAVSRVTWDAKKGLIVLST